jgi:hypothetical protein
LTYDWDFGDSSTHSTDVTPLHTFQTISTFNIKLIVTDTLSRTAQNSFSFTSLPKILEGPKGAMNDFVGDTNVNTPLDLAYKTINSKDMLFTANNAFGLSSVDVTNKTDPKVVGTLRPIPSPASTIAVMPDQNIAVLGGDGTSTKDTKIINITDPTRPQIISSIPDLYGNITTSGNYAFVGQDKVKVVDLAIPSNPQIKSTITLPAAAADMVTHNNLLYITSNNILYTYDVADHTSPNKLSEFNIGTGFYVTYISYGNNMIFATGSNNFKIIDVSIPNSPSLKGSLAFNINFAAGETAFFNGHYVAFCANERGIVIIDVQDPINPLIIGETIGDPMNRYHSKKIILQGDYAYAAEIYGSIMIVNIANPSQPTAIYRLFKQAGGSSAIIAINNHLIALSGWNGIKIIDIGDLEYPTYVSKLTGFNSVQDTALLGNNLLVLDRAQDQNANQIKIINISDTSNPVLAGALVIPNITKFEVKGNLVYITGSDSVNLINSKFYIYDFSNPLSPNKMSELNLNRKANSGLFIKDNFACVSQYEFFSDGKRMGQQLQLIDISNSNSPVIKGTIISSWGQDQTAVFFQDHYLAVANKGASEYGQVVNREGLSIFDIQNPSVPVLVGPLYSDCLSCNLSNFFIIGNYAYVSSTINYKRGAAIFDLSNLARPKLVQWTKGTQAGYSEGEQIVLMPDGSKIITTDPSVVINTYVISSSQPTVSLQKSCTPTSAFSNQQIVCTITLINPTGGQVLNNANITDVLDTRLEFISADNGGQLQDDHQTVLWNLGNLTEGQGKTVTVNVKVRQQ